MDFIADEFRNGDIIMKPNHTAGSIKYRADGIIVKINCGSVMRAAGRGCKKHYIRTCLTRTLKLAIILDVYPTIRNYRAAIAAVAWTAFNQPAV